MTAPYKMEKITWDDHWSMSSGWQHMSEVDAEPLPIESIGYVIKESKKGVLLAGQWNMRHPDTVGGLLFIIKKCIIKRKKLK